MVGRPLEFDPEQALGRAIDAFWNRGYEATSISDVLEAMGINRASLYNSFGDKHALFTQALERYSEEHHAYMCEVVEGSESSADGLRDLLALWQKNMSRNASRGCLIVNTAAEVAPHDKAIAKLVRQHYERMEQMLTQAIRRARDEGELAAETEPRTVARVLIATANGVMMMAKAGLPAATTRSVLKHTAAQIGL